MTDNIYHPTHYEQASITLQPIDVIKYAPAMLFNVFKYVLRAGYKEGKKIEDLDKAQRYLDWAVDEYTLIPEKYSEFLKYYGMFILRFERFKKIPIQTLGNPVFFMEHLGNVIEEVRYGDL